jgi:hypothetical protein
MSLFSGNITMKNLIFRSEVINLLATKLYSPLAGIELTKGTLSRLQIDVRANFYMYTVQRYKLDIKTTGD